MTLPAMRRRIRGHGATLVEVVLGAILVVLLVVGILWLMMRPAILDGWGHYAADTATRIQSLSAGATSFKQENGFYPGQDDRLQWEGKYTGSQVLAAHLLGLYRPDAADPYEVFAPGYSGLVVPTSEYAIYKPGMLRAHSGAELAIRDCYPSVKPICYYPSASGIGVEQYRFEDNAAYTARSEEVFCRFITDRRAVTGSGGVVPSVRSGQFLLIAPGKDRRYFTKDDQCNWDVP